jgi:FlgD Ig-like domain
MGFTIIEHQHHGRYLVRLPNFVFFLTVCLFLTVCTAGANTQPLATYGHPAFEVVNEDLASGLITEGEAHLIRVQLMLDPEAVDSKYKLEGPSIKSGTMILMEALAKAETFSPEIQEQLDFFRVRPSGLPETMVSDHFICHYTYSGPNGIPNDIYAEFVLEAAEVSYEKFHVTQGWQIPPGDGTIGGGTNMIDVYIRDLGTGILGLANAEYAVAGGTPCDYVGFFNCDNSLYRDLYYVTTAHEYMHIVQFGYCRNNNLPWFMENCAMMGEEWAYDSINDYPPYLNAWFGKPYMKLHHFDGQYEYGGIVWPMYLNEVFGWELVRDIWARLKVVGDPWTAFDDVFPTYGTWMEDEYINLIRWCHYTGFRDDHNHFEEGGTWSTYLTPDRTFHSYPVVDEHPTSTKKPGACGTSLMRLRHESGSPDNILEVSFEGNNRHYAVEFIWVAADNITTVEYAMTLDANYEGYIEIPDMDLANDVYMFVSCDRWGGSGQDYVLNASTRHDSQSADDLNMGDNVRIHPSYPNPFALKTNLAYSLPQQSDVAIKIYDTTGRMVRDLYSNDTQRPGDYEVSWNGQDNNGTDVGNGVYFANIVVNGEKTIRELTVIR